jgi:hypothetical protein
VNSSNSNLDLADHEPIAVDESVLSSTEPVVLRGLVAEWPMVKAGRESPLAATDYLKRFYSGRPVTASYAGPEIKGRIGYNDTLTGFNFQVATLPLDEFLGRLFAHIDDAEPPASYIGSTLVDNWFPGFRQENDLALDVGSPLVSLWIGNQIKVSAHFDFSDNVACCVAGRRRFTLFPPEQLDNLYVGPWDRTPAGQAISLVDLLDPDFERFPRFREALKTAREFVLEPGDALFLPSMWWHHVEGLDGLNMLVNFWWRSTPHYMGSPLNVLKHALLSLRGLPPAQREAWRHILDYYVFGAGDEATAHIPESSRGILGTLDENSANSCDRSSIPIGGRTSAGESARFSTFPSD